MRRDLRPECFFYVHRARIAALALRRRLPTIFDVRNYAEAGGLASYGSDYFNVMESTGNYVARVLKGEKPADLPVQQATKFELVINRKTAKALGIEVSRTLLATADDVIEWSTVLTELSGPLADQEFLHPLQHQLAGAG